MLPKALLTLGLASLSLATPHRRANCGSNPPAAEDPSADDTTRNIVFSGTYRMQTTTFSPATGKFGEISARDTTLTHSWLLFNEPFIYAPNEWGDTLHVYKMGSNDAADFEEIQNVTFTPGVVSVEFSPDKKTLFTGSYSAGVVDIFSVNPETGMLGEAPVQTIEGPGTAGFEPTEGENDAPRVHQVLADPTGEFIAATAFRTDVVFVIPATPAEDGTYSIISEASTTEGCRPRHGSFFPQGDAPATHYFVVCEKSATVEVFTVSYGEGGMQFTGTGQSISTIPTSGDFVPGNITTTAPGELLVSPDSKHVYVSNRNTNSTTDSIAIFSIEGMDSGAGSDSDSDYDKRQSAVSLVLSDVISSGGVHPRMFSFSKDGSMLFSSNYVAGQAIIAFERDGETGALEVRDFIEHEVAGGMQGPTNLGPQFVMEF